jgi:hypothetical protein
LASLACLCCCTSPNGAKAVISVARYFQIADGDATDRHRNVCRIAGFRDDRDMSVSLVIQDRQRSVAPTRFIATSPGRRTAAMYRSGVLCGRAAAESA